MKSRQRRKADLALTEKLLMERAQPSPLSFLSVDTCVAFIYWEVQVLQSPERFFYLKIAFISISLYG